MKVELSALMWSYWEASRHLYNSLFFDQGPDREHDFRDVSDKLLEVLLLRDFVPEYRSPEHEPVPYYQAIKVSLRPAYTEIEVSAKKPRTAVYSPVTLRAPFDDFRFMYFFDWRDDEERASFRYVMVFAKEDSRAPEVRGMVVLLDVDAVEFHTDSTSFGEPP